jgi:hypothetical protein
MEIVRGEARTLAIRFLEYKEETGRLEPVDLTGTHVRFSAKEIPKFAELGIHIKALGGEVKADLRYPLSEEEALIYVGLDDDAKIEFVRNTLPRSCPTRLGLCWTERDWLASPGPLASVQRSRLSLHSMPSGRSTTVQGFVFLERPITLDLPCLKSRKYQVPPAKPSSQKRVSPSIMPTCLSMKSTYCGCLLNRALSFRICLRVKTLGSPPKS